MASLPSLHLHSTLLPHSPLRSSQLEPFGFKIPSQSHKKPHRPHHFLLWKQNSGVPPLRSALSQNGSPSADRPAFERPIRTLLIDNYDSYTYNLYQLLFVINGVAPVVVKNDEICWEDLRRLLYEDGAFDSIVISPGPGSPVCPKDIGICMQVLEECGDIPILGVCMGHQALGYASGARVVHAPEPVHGRLSEIEHMGCPLFKNIPSGFRAVRYHSLMLDTESFPEDLLPTAWTVGSYSAASSANPARVVMGISHMTRPHYGVQFHPESVATTFGKQILENFRDLTAEFWQTKSIQKDARDSCSESFRSHVRDCISQKKLSNPKCTSRMGADINTRGRASSRLYWEKVDGLAERAGGSEGIFCGLFGGGSAQDTFWLDSSLHEQGGARFSFMGGKGGPLWKRISYEMSTEKSR